MHKEAWWQKIADNPHMAWCLRVASLGVDELLKATLIPKSEFDRAKKIIAEEIFVRLCLDDLPPAGQAAGYPGKLVRLSETTSAKPPRPPR